MSIATSIQPEYPQKNMLATVYRDEGDAQRWIKEI